MRAVIVTEPGGPEALTVVDLPDPEPGPGEVLVEVAATAVNRADIMQRQGFYPPPPGASDVLGLECSGTVAALGEGVSGWAVGDEVCALLAGGGYAELVAVPAGQLMPVPDGVDLVTAALDPGGGLHGVVERVHDRRRSSPARRCSCTAARAGSAPSRSSSPARCRRRCSPPRARPRSSPRVRELGADVTINYRDEDFVEVLREAGGADVILDNMGAKYLGRNVDALATEGRLVVIGLQGGTKGELDLGTLLRKRGAVIATTLRSRPTEEKAIIVASVVEHVWPLVADGQVRPIVHATMPLDRGRRRPPADGGEQPHRQDRAHPLTSRLAA